VNTNVCKSPCYNTHIDAGRDDEITAVAAVMAVLKLCDARTT
jgi:hypothetical protein